MQQTNTGVLLLNWDNEENILIRTKKITHWKTPLSIIIIDNASKTDISSFFDGAFQGVRFIRNSENIGFSGGNNIGFHYFIKEKYEYVLILNHDADISEEIVQTLLKEMEKDPEIGAIGPCIQEGSKKYAGGRNIAHYPATRIPYDPTGLIIREVDYLPGAACIFRVSVLEKAGLFDERYFFSGEMADLCQRIWHFGYKCVIHTGVCIKHDIGQDIPMRERIHIYYSLRNRFLYIRKHERYVHIWMIFWIFFALILVIGAIYRKKSYSARAALLGLRDGLLGKYGDQNGYFIH